VIHSATGSGAWNIAVADFNGDGKLDAVTIGDSGESILLGNGDGTFQAPAHIGAPSRVYALAVGDFNLDGRVDIAMSYTLVSNAPTGQSEETDYGTIYYFTVRDDFRIWVLQGMGGGTFGTALDMGVNVSLYQTWGFDPYYLPARDNNGAT